MVMTPIGRWFVGWNAFTAAQRLNAAASTLCDEQFVADVADYVTAVPDEVLLTLLELGHRPARSPEVNMLFYDQGADVAVVLNRFQRDEAEALARSGRNGPHRHGFDFATRLLTGGYQHVSLTAGNDGELDAEVKTYYAGVVYRLKRTQVHLVTDTEDGTETLMLRVNHSFRPSPDRSPLTHEALSERRRNILAALHRAAPLANGG